MQHSSAHRGQIEPLVALAAVAVVGLALAAYAGAFEASIPGPTDRNLAQAAADRVERSLTVGGVVRPGRLAEAVDSGPRSYRTNVTLSIDGVRRSLGPAVPSTADNASRRVSARQQPGTVVPGRLEVHVWT